jgi:toxin secretion/phage lysis holin
MHTILLFARGALPGTKTEACVMGAAAAIGAALETILGGFDRAVIALFVFAALDYLTGCWAAARQGKLNSRTGFAGLAKKAAIFMAVAFGYGLDVAMKTDALRNMLIFAYSANEGLSILENVDKLGYGRHIPPFLRKKIEQLKSEKNINRINSEKDESGGRGNAG